MNRDVFVDIGKYVFKRSDWIKTGGLIWNQLRSENPKLNQWSEPPSLEQLQTAAYAEMKRRNVIPDNNVLRSYGFLIGYYLNPDKYFIPPTNINLYATINTVAYQQGGNTGVNNGKNDGTGQATQAGSGKGNSDREVKGGLFYIPGLSELATWFKESVLKPLGLESLPDTIVQILMVIAVIEIIKIVKD